MFRINRLGLAFPVACLLAAGAADLAAKTKKGDKYLKEGRQLQAQEKWDLALEAFELALAEDPSDPAYQMAVRRVRFQASAEHVKTGQKLRDQGKLDEALAEFQKAFTIDPSSTIAEQELRQTYRMVKDRDRKKAAKPDGADDEALLTPTEEALEEARKRIARLQPIPELKPISRHLNTLRMNNQPAKVLYETVGKLAGINVVFDPEFQATGKNVSVDLSNTTLEEALRHLSVLTKTYWKPLSPNTILVTNDNVTKRRDYEEQVVKVFYLENVTKVQELQEIATAVRSVTDIRRLFTYNSQNAILVRGEADKVALAEKLIHDLDKPLSEVVVDVIVMEASRSRTRDLAASLTSGGKSGLSFPINFNPRNAISGGGTGGTDDGGDNPGGGQLRLGDIANVGVNDWTSTLPGMLLQALMTDASTRILQRPQVRAADGQKASLRLGDRIPFATGSFQPGVGAVGVSPLVSTQFQYADVGVNVDLTPKIHGESEISMHIEIEISAVRERIDVGGIEQPVIGQRKVAEDIRVRNGEVTLLGGLTNEQTTENRSGVPGLADIPLIRWLGFSSQGKERVQSELLIALVPRIVRKPEISAENLRGVAAGTDQIVDVNFAAAVEEEEQARPEQPAAPAAPPAPDAPEPAKPKPAESGAPGPEPAAAPAALRFDPPSVRAKIGASVTVTLLLDNGTDIFNAPMRFQFDPKLLRLTDVAQGNLLRGDGQQVIFTRNILNDAGAASIVLNRLPGAGGISGSGALVSLTFQAVGAGTAQLTVPDLTVRDSQMQPVPVTAPVLNVTVEQ